MEWSALDGVLTSEASYPGGVALRKGLDTREGEYFRRDWPGAVVEWDERVETDVFRVFRYG